MTESAYSLFKSPTSLDKRQGFSGRRLRGFQGRVHYTPNLAQEINLSRNQRCFSQFDRKTDCFDGGCGGASNVLPSKGEDARYSSAATLKAVCGTQTRHGVSVNKYQADSQLGEWLCLTEIIEGLISTNVRSARNMHLRAFVVICTSEIFSVGIVIILLEMCRYRSTDRDTNQQSNWQKSAIGPTAVRKCSPRTGTYVDWGPEYTPLVLPNVERAEVMPVSIRSEYK